jgi:hypothetical protein
MTFQKTEEGGGCWQMTQYQWTLQTGRIQTRKKSFCGKSCCTYQVVAQAFRNLSYQSLQLLSNDGRVDMIPKLPTMCHVHVCGGCMTRKKTK